MNRRIGTLSLLTVVLAAGLVGAAGCRKKPPAEPVAPAAPPPAEAPAPTPPPPPPPPPPAPAEPAAPARPPLETLNGQLQTVYFDFDQSDVRADARSAIAVNIGLIKKYPDLKVSVEGHCDERGTVEYNLALGDRRTAAVIASLVEGGIARNRLTSVSYGEERPADPGHSEAAWTKNRRAEFRFVNP